MENQGGSSAPARSNRTFMELKYVQFNAVIVRQPVLIVPLWN